MIVTLTKDIMLRLQKDQCGSQTIDDAVNSYWGSSRGSDIDCSKLTLDQIDKLMEYLRGSKLRDEKRIYRTLESYRMMDQNPGGAGVTSLQMLVEAVKAYIAPTEHKWVFVERRGMLLPYYVASVKYVPASQYSSAHVSMQLKSVHRGEAHDITSTWNRGDLKGKPNVSQCLRRNGLYLETTELVAEYEKSMNWYRTIQDSTGDQFLASGVGYGSPSGSTWSIGTVSLEREGQPTRVVMDDLFREKDSDGSGSRTKNNVLYADDGFWQDFSQKKTAQRRKSGADTDADDDDDDNDTVGTAQMLPIHPYVNVFDLKKHFFLEVHVDNLEPYEYDNGMADKLILPHDHIELIDMLLGGEKALMEDIVSGKTGGIIVLCTGSPGTGKTLTAEVYSEKIQRPLYVVQCSQLGTDEKQLESRLAVVLSRAQRWNAILLVDEADVYIRSRDEDIHQNAIVGVFLRLLEYYNGVIIMTSNLPDSIDDAILSRRTAHIHYHNPDRDLLQRIWYVLLAQYGISERSGLLDGVYHEIGLVDDLLRAFPEISGRDVKNLCKLAKFRLDKTSETVGIDTFRKVAKFLDIKERTDSEWKEIVAKSEGLLVRAKSRGRSAAD